MSKGLGLNWKPAPKTRGEKIAGDIIFVAIGTFLVLITWGVVKLVWLLITWPFKFLYNCHKKGNPSYLELGEPDIEGPSRELKKQWKMEKDPSNPMNLYKDDPKNVENLKWYKDWKAGKVIDTCLLWAPSCWKDPTHLTDYDDDDHFLSKGYVNYLDIQYQLHKGNGFLQKRTFLRYIKNATPVFDEVSKPKDFDGIEKFIPKMRELADEDHAKCALIKELCKRYGLTYDIAVKLINEEYSGKELEARADVVGVYCKRGCSKDVLSFLIFSGLDSRIIMEPDRTETLRRLIDDMGVLPNAAYRRALDDFTNEDIIEIIKAREDHIKRMEEREEDSDSDIYGTRQDAMYAAYEDILEERKSLRDEEMVEKDIGDAVWNS